MDHQEIKDKLLAFRDPEMIESERKEITLHLSACSECQSLFSRWERAGSALRRTPLPEASESFVSRVMDRLEEMEEPREAPVRIRWQLPRWAAMSLGYGFGIFLMFLAIANRQPGVNASTVLLADVPQNTQWTFDSENPDSGQVLGVLKEDV